jgi:putative DNA primase/helicase
VSRPGVNFDAIPSELKALLRWVLWRYGKPRKDGKREKRPLRPNGRAAKTNEPSTWSAFDAVKATFEGSRIGTFDGIGFVLSREDGLVGVDLDDCIGDDGTIIPWAQEWLREVRTYWERSPSGRGLRAFLRGALPERFGNGINRTRLGGGKVEAYQAGRYLTVTGNHIPGTPATLERQEHELGARLARQIVERPTGWGVSGGTLSARDSKRDEPGDHVPPTPVGTVTSENSALVDRLRSDLGEPFCALYDRGDIRTYNGDDSAADWGLVKDLARACGRDPIRIDRLFRSSALYRRPGRAEKWDECHSADGRTYGQLTIAKAIEGQGTSGAPSDGPIVFRRLVDVETEAVEWAWQDRIAYGKVTLFAGDPGEGKSFAALAFAAAETRGKRLPGDDRGPCDPVEVLLASFEDGAGDTIRPRADSLGADVGVIHLLEGSRDVAGNMLPFSLDDIPKLLVKLETYPRVRVFIVDPVSALLANVDSHKDADVRSKLAALTAFAELRRIAVVLVAHLNKNEARKAVYRVGGSIGFVALARSVLLFGRDPDSGRRAIVPLKSNLAALAAAVEYSIQDGLFSWGGVLADVTADKLCHQKNAAARRGLPSGSSHGYESRVVRLVREWREPDLPTQAAILLAIGGNRNDVLAALARACERRPPVLRRHGAGVKGRPFRYEVLPE